MTQDPIPADAPTGSPTAPLAPPAPEAPPRRCTLVETAAALEACAAAIARAPVVAVDTESNGFFAYFEKVCLVQLATAEEDFAVDTLAVGLGPLAPLLADPARELVLHAAEFDVLSLRRDYGLRLGRIFDTHAAAKVLGAPRVGLGDLLADELGVKLTLDEQRSDWGRRPLTPEQVEYAFADVRHLLPLRARFGERLAAQGRLAEAQAEFDRVRVKEPRPRPFDPEAWQRLGVAGALDDHGRAVLRELFLLRDRRARELNRPPFKVMGEQLLGELAKRKPRTEAALEAVPGGSSSMARRMAQELLAAIATGLAAEPIAATKQPRRGGPPWKRGPHPDAEVEQRYEALRKWRKKRAEERKVEVQVIAPNAVLLAVAKAAPATQEALAAVDGMDAYRVEQLGEQLLQVLGGLQAPKPAAG